MKTSTSISIMLFLLLVSCAATSEVLYDYDLDVDFNQYDSYVLCVEDFTVEYLDNPRIDNKTIRQLIGEAVGIEMESKAHRTNVFEPQLQAGFKIIISEETVQFRNCEHSESLEYWESCKIEEQTYEQESLIVYVSDFNTNKVLWHASIICDLNKSKKKLQPYINNLVKELFIKYPKTQVAQNPDDSKEFKYFASSPSYCLRTSRTSPNVLRASH